MSDPAIHSHLSPPSAIDSDPQETAEWRDAIASVLAGAGPQRVRELMDMLARAARDPGVAWEPVRGTPYVNTIAANRQTPFPGDLAIEERLGALMRWNALAMVMRANKAYGELGGHIASYASAADLFEVGYNHFFRAPPTPPTRPIRRPASMPAPSSKAGSARTTWPTTARKSAPPKATRRACPAIRIPG